MTILINPASANWKAYAGGSNTCFKAINKGGPTPTQITDSSGRGNHGVFTTAPEPVQVGDLWAYQFVSGDSEYVTVPDITELLGATAATWCAWVRKDAYVQNQCIAGDFLATANNAKWLIGREAAENTLTLRVGDGTTYVESVTASIFTSGWKFVWCRFTGNSATGLEGGVGDSVVTPVSTTTVAALGSASQNKTYIGKFALVYSSMTLAALAIWPSAISDADINKWRYMTQKFIPL